MTYMTDNHFFYRKLHSLLGVIPIGFFLVEHLLANFSATKGPEAFQNTVAFIDKIPFVVTLEILFIFIPILFHGVYGLYIAFQAKSNVGNYGYFRNVMFMLQRVTGVITLVYIGWHVYETRIQVAIGSVEKANLGRLMSEILVNPWMYAFYVIGIIAAVFHFCNGMWSFLVSWGVTIGPRAQQVSTYVWMIAFVLISLLGISALNAFVDPQFIEQVNQG
jgi:succinate dehydrogenase / fumarate reductase cytochrome b subunit